MRCLRRDSGGAGHTFAFGPGSGQSGGARYGAPGGSQNEYNGPMDAQPITRADLVELLGALKADIVAEFRTDLAALRTELTTELAALQTELKAELAALRTDLDAKLAETKQDILDSTQEKIRDAQTEILKAFLPYQERTNVRFRGLEAKVSTTEAELRARMEILEARLDQIETRLHLEPPAAPAA